MEDGQLITPMWVVAAADGVFIPDHSGLLQQTRFLCRERQPLQVIVIVS